MPRYLPRYNTRMLRMQIDHDRFSSTNVDTLCRRILYPPFSKTYTGNERLNAVLKSLRDHTETDEKLAAFAYCVSRDTRMGNRIRKFSMHALDRSRLIQRQKQVRLGVLKDRWNDLEQSTRQFDRQLARNAPTWTAEERDDIREYGRFIRQFRNEMKRGFDQMPEWDHIGYNRLEFDIRVQDEIRNQTALVLTQGVGKLPLPNNMKREVLNRAKRAARVPARRTRPTRGPGNAPPMGYNSGSNWN